MKTKMLGALKKRYSNLGLSDEQFNLVVPMAVLGLADDADEASIEARASESYISDMLKNMQSQSDKIRTLEKKPKKDGDDGNKGGEPTGDAKLDAIMALLNEQKTTNAALQKRLDDLEGAGKQKDFDSLVKRIGKELGMSASILDLVKPGLSSDMDEKSVRDALGAKKKALVDEGVKFDDGGSQHGNGTQSEAEKEAAKAWVEQHKVS